MCTVSRRLPSFFSIRRQFSSIPESLQHLSAPSKEILVDVSPLSAHVYHLRLNRPDRRNALTFKQWAEMKTVVEGLAKESSCRAIVVSGNGLAFCSGIDLQHGITDVFETLSSKDLDIGRKALIINKFIQTAQDGFNALANCPKPVIAAVHSHCLGVGTEMALACDVRFAAADSVFSIKEVEIGLAADVGALSRLQKVVGNDSWVREVCFTARHFSADEALKQGLISRIYPSAKETLEAATDLAKRIAENSPIAVQGTKLNLNYSRDHSVADGQEFVKTWNMAMLQADDLLTSAQAALNKQKPTFKDI